MGVFGKSNGKASSESKAAAFLKSSVSTTPKFTSVEPAVGDEQDDNDILPTPGEALDAVIVNMVNDIDMLQGQVQFLLQLALEHGWINAKDHPYVAKDYSGKTKDSDHTDPTIRGKALDRSQLSRTHEGVVKPVFPSSSSSDEN